LEFASKEARRSVGELRLLMQVGKVSNCIGGQGRRLIA